MKVLFLTCFLLIITTTCVAQSSADDLVATIKLIGKSNEDTIFLRWAISNASLWESALKNGFILERAVMTDEKQPEAALKFFKVKQSPIKPWTTEEWASVFKILSKDTASTDYKMMSATEGFGEPFDPGKNSENNVFSDKILSGGVESLIENKQKSEYKYALAILASSRSFITGCALGLGYADTEVQAGKTYMYKISPNFDPKPYKVEPGKFTIRNLKFNPGVYQSTVFSDSGDKEIMISALKHIEIFSYSVERSEEGKPGFLNLTPTPVMKPAKGGDKFFHLDNEGLQNGHKYTYKLFGVTNFGDKVLIGSCSAIPKDLTPPGQPLLLPLVHMAAKKLVQVSWKIPEPVEADLKGFIIGRCDSIEGPFTAIHTGVLDKSLRTYFDSKFDEKKSNYYIIEAVDKADNVRSSMPAYLTLIDETPPIKPLFLKGIIDTNGVVVLTIKPNPEQDLMGYRFFRSNAIDHEFSVIYETYAHENDIVKKTNVFRDTVTLKSLTKYIYYKVTALDFHYNESVVSEVVKVARPDKISPVTPVITDYQIIGKKLELKFVESASDDVAKYAIFKRKQGVKKWDLYKELMVTTSGNDEIRSIVDTTLVANQTYEYAIQAIDDSGLKSEVSVSLLVRAYFNSMTQAPKMSGIYDKDNKKVTLSWTTPNIKYPEYFMLVYRSLNSDGWQSIGRVNSGQKNEYLDKIFSNYKHCSYKIKLVTKEGESVPSDSIVFVFLKPENSTPPGPSTTQARPAIPPVTPAKPANPSPTPATAHAKPAIPPVTPVKPANPSPTPATAHAKPVPTPPTTPPAGPSPTQPQRISEILESLPAENSAIALAERNQTLSGILQRSPKTIEVNKQDQGAKGLTLALSVPITENPKKKGKSIVKTILGRVIFNKPMEKPGAIFIVDKNIVVWSAKINKNGNFEFPGMDIPVENLYSKLVYVIHSDETVYLYKEMPSDVLNR